MDDYSRTFKIKCGHVLRRVIYENRYDTRFRTLESVIRTQFNIPDSSKFRITYTDVDNEEVTMADDDDFNDACFGQNIDPLHMTVLLQEEESRSSARNARPPEPLTADPPRWAADILLKLDQLLLAVNKLLVGPAVASRSPASTKREERFLGAGKSSIAGSSTEPVKGAVPFKGRRFDNAQSRSDSEFQRRASIQRQSNDRRSE